jgi:hypothetical protein
MSKIKVDRISNRAGTGAPEFVNGIKIVGITSVGDIVGAAATFNSVSIGGTLIRRTSGFLGMLNTFTEIF